jgi:predicted MPP superfamily phosphohydrolase
MLSRRRFLQGTAALAGTGLATATWARWGEIHWVEFVDHPLPLADLPPALEGVTLMQLSDLHIGPQVSERFLRSAFAAAVERAPAFVAYTGDFVTWEGPEQLDQIDRMFRHAPRGSLGTFAVLGNHDYGRYWSDRTVAAGIQRRLEDQGITVLRNALRTVGGLQFVGFEDIWSPLFGADRLMPRRDPARSTVVLCHNPDACDQPIWDAFSGWILSGHTHGGQVALPLVGAPLVPVRNKRYVAGAYELSEGRSLYINRALGHTLPVRFGVRPEITLHRLLGAVST